MSSTTDYAVSPGEFLRDWLQENHKTQQQLADDLGVSRKHVNQLLGGASLSPTMAANLSLVTGYGTDWWLRAEAVYQADKARIAQEEELARHVGSIPKPVAKYLRDYGYTRATKRQPGQLVMDVFAFFGVATFEALQRRFDRPAAAFRQEFSTKTDWTAVATWLRQGEIEAADQVESLPPYDGDALLEVIPDLPKLSREKPELYGTEVIKRLHRAGVGLIYISEIPGCRAHGVTQWRSGHPVVQLSLRRKNDADFWFSLMHELNHVLHDPHDQLMLQGPAEAASDPREIAANNFARVALIPECFDERLCDIVTDRDIESLASEIGVSTGIVVGRLQHERLFDYSRGQRHFKRIDVSNDVA